MKKTIAISILATILTVLAINQFRKLTTLLPIVGRHYSAAVEHMKG